MSPSVGTCKVHPVLGTAGAGVATVPRTKVISRSKLASTFASLKLAPLLASAMVPALRMVLAVAISA